MTAPPAPGDRRAVSTRYLAFMPWRRLLLPAAGFLLTLACFTSTEPRALSVSLTATDTTLLVNQDVDFIVQASGAGIGSVHIAFGDTGEEIFFAAGSDNARATFPHRYESAGSFTVLTTVQDSRTTRTATLVVTVQ